jgi:glutaredoxin
MTHKIFGAEWCGNCKTAKQFLDAQGVAYEYIDIDQFPDVAQANTIRSLPTMITEAGDRVIGSAKIKEFVTSQSN